MGVAPIIAWLFIGRAIAGVAGAFFTPAYAYVAHVRRAQNFGLMGAAFGIGFILGPAIGGLLGTFGPRAPFFTAGIIALANATLGYFALPPNRFRPTSAGGCAPTRSHPHADASVPGGAVHVGALLPWQIAHQVLPSTWAFYTISKFHWTSSQVGYSLAFVGLAMAVAQGALTRVLIPWLGGSGAQRSPAWARRSLPTSATRLRPRVG